MGLTDKLPPDKDLKNMEYCQHRVSAMSMAYVSREHAFCRTCDAKSKEDKDCYIPMPNNPRNRRC